MKGLTNAQAINDGTLTIQKNGASVGTFTANQSGNTTVNITVPVKTSELTNDSGFVSSISLPYINCTMVAQSSVGSTDVDLTWNSVSKSPNNNTYYTYSNGVITVKQTGRYQLNAQIYGHCSTPSRVEVSVWKSGTIVYLADNYVAVSGKNVSINVSGIFAMNVNDTIRVKSWCEDGTFTLSNNYSACGFELLKVQ